MSPDNKYDYLVVGAGLFGAVFAYEARRRGKQVLVIDRRKHSGGNIHCETVEGINVHKYGAHIFHTDDAEVWQYVNRFAEFNRYTNSPLANYYGKLYNLPFNMNTFYQLWQVTTPQEAQAKIAAQASAAGIEHPRNLEEQAISMVGHDIYERLIRGYTEKQWGKKATELPAFIIKRIPVRFTFDNNYFNDRYQGIPIGGYNQITDKLLAEVDLRVGTDYFANREHFSRVAKKTIFTGMIDEFFGYRFGALEYRSLRFEQEISETANYQGNAVVNYTDIETPFTRIIEHKHFEFGTQQKTVITREYSENYSIGKEPYYPINTPENQRRYEQYREMATAENNVIFAGRLGEYRYYDMHHIVRKALDLAGNEFGHE